MTIHLFRYSDPAHDPDVARLGLEVDNVPHALSAPLRLADLFSDTKLSAAELVDRVRRTQGAPLDMQAIRLLPPLDTQEVWAAGVTYKRSEEARETESHNSTIYTRVYSATRPELFFKAPGAEVVAPDDLVGIRADARWSVPEPELVVAFNAALEVVGFTIGNDMSSRDIEGENPLYLPQAKVYDRACAIGPKILLAPGATEWPELGIAITIQRDGAPIFSGETATTQIHRSLHDLGDYLGRCKTFRSGVFLFTGTGIIPPDDFTLHVGDVIQVRIDTIGELVNTVTQVGR